MVNIRYNMSINMGKYTLRITSISSPHNNTHNNNIITQQQHNNNNTD